MTVRTAPSDDTSLSDEGLKARAAMILRNEATRQGVSQAQLAERASLSQPDVSRILRGQLKGFSLFRLLEILTALGMDVEIAVRSNPDGIPGRQTLRVG